MEQSFGSRTSSARDVIERVVTEAFGEGVTRHPVPLVKRPEYTVWLRGKAVLVDRAKKSE
jgi:hypothetical protein